MRKSTELRARDGRRRECSSWRSLLLLLFETRTSDSCINNEALVLKSIPSWDRKFALKTKHFFNWRNSKLKIRKWRTGRGFQSPETRENNNLKSPNYYNIWFWVCSQRWWWNLVNHQKKKPKHSNKGEYKEQNGRIHVQEHKWTTLESGPQGEHQVLEPPWLRESISNKEREGPFETTTSLDEPSPTAIARFKIKIVYVCYNATHTFCIWIVSK
jgi:hypothetical protein